MTEVPDAWSMPNDDPTPAASIPPDPPPEGPTIQRALHRPLSEQEMWELLRLFDDLFPPYSIIRLGLLHFADGYVEQIPGWLREKNLGDVLDAFQELRVSGRMRPGR